MKYAIGLDIGIESVGFSVLELDSNDQPFRIEKLGARIFDRAENPKDGSSLALPRREARGARRRLRRRRHRLERIRGLIVASGIISEEKLEKLYDGQLEDIYAIRARALDEPISPEDFARILIHLAQRRGFKSNRKSEEQSDKESGKLLAAVSANLALCEEKGYRTIGEMMLLDEKFAEAKRNKSGEYKTTVDRASIEAEARLIFESQRNFGAAFASENTENAYVSILTSQRSFAEGPACGPYSGNQIERMRGHCTFEETEIRAAKATYSFQLFNLWQHINHMRIKLGDSTSPLTEEQRRKVYVLAHEKSEFSYAQLRKALNLDDSADFAGIQYEHGKRDEVEKKTKIKDLKIYHDVKKALKNLPGKAFEGLSHDQLDAIGEAVSKNLSDSAIIKELTDAGISHEIANAVISLPNYPKPGHLSLIACRKILHFLEEGMTYDKACAAAGYDHKAQKTDPKKTLPPLANDDGSITNPVVRRAISQTIKVINAIILDMGRSPVYVNIELARELSRDRKERDRIKKEQEGNARRNEEAMDQLREYFTSPTGRDLVKFKLWQEQGEICMYSGEHIDLERLNEPGYVDVDHIIPYSMCFDDGNANKVLVLARENRQKGNRLPLQYLQGKRRDDFIVRINNLKIRSTKKNRLLNENITDENEWKRRNLQDTQYISSFMHGYITENLMFDESEMGRKRRVTAVNGAITSYVRKRWGIQKIRENGDLHHAVDATVIGCISQSMINRISKYSYYKETLEVGEYAVDPQTGEVFDRFPAPWPHFKDELEIRLTQNADNLRKQLFDVNYPSYAEIPLDSVFPPFVSRMANHKITGAAHKETVKSARLSDYGKTVSKVPLENLKLENGEIVGYYNKESDLLLYNALKAELEKHGGNAKAAFEGREFRKPKSDGTPGPVVKKVKIIEVSSSTVPVHGGTGLAQNDTTVRCDVFYVENDGYYFVPVYVADTVKAELPNLAPTSAKDNGRKIYKRMDDKDFVFSLYPNDLFRIFSRSKISLNVINEKGTLPKKLEIAGETGTFLYYKGLDVSTACISGVTHDNTYKHRSIGKTMQKIEKYEVDVLGRIRKIEKETRKPFNIKKD